MNGEVRWEVFQVDSFEKRHTCYGEPLESFGFDDLINLVRDTLEQQCCRRPRLLILVSLTLVPVLGFSLCSEPTQASWE